MAVIPIPNISQVRGAVASPQMDVGASGVIGRAVADSSAQIGRALQARDERQARLEAEQQTAHQNIFENDYLNRKSVLDAQLKELESEHTDANELKAAQEEALKAFVDQYKDVDMSGFDPVFAAKMHSDMQKDLAVERLVIKGDYNNALAKQETVALESMAEYHYNKGEIDLGRDKLNALKDRGYYTKEDYDLKKQEMESLGAYSVLQNTISAAAELNDIEELNRLKNLVEERENLVVTHKYPALNQIDSQLREINRKRNGAIVRAAISFEKGKLIPEEQITAWEESNLISTEEAVGMRFSNRQIAEDASRADSIKAELETGNASVIVDELTFKYLTRADGKTKGGQKLYRMSREDMDSYMERIQLIEDSVVRNILRGKLLEAASSSIEMGADTGGEDIVEQEDSYFNPDYTNDQQSLIAETYRALSVVLNSSKDTYNGNGLYALTQALEKDALKQETWTAKERNEFTANFVKDCVKGIIDQRLEANQQPTQTATNPETGQRIGLINGEWVEID